MAELSFLGEAIIAMVKKDEVVRTRLLNSGELTKGYHPEMEVVHRENARQLDKIIQAFGWPGVSLVGEKASQAAWLIVQHAIGEPDFLYRCRKTLREAVLKEQATPQQLAQLEDRVHFFERNPQRYGTQFDWDENGELSPWKIAESNRVNEYRKALGWETIEEKTTQFRMNAEKANSEPPDFQQRMTEMESWRKSVGWEIPFSFLETDRLLLREYNPTIMQLVHERYDQPDLSLFFGTTDKKELEIFRDKANETLTMYKHTFKYWHLISKATREVIGWCGFHTWKLRHDWAEVGYVLSREDFRKQGLMKEALHRVVEFGFQEMNLNRISAFVGPYNEPSLQLIRGLGFEQEGRLREDYRTPEGLTDSLAFGLLKRDYHKA